MPSGGFGLAIQSAPVWRGHRGAISQFSSYSNMSSWGTYTGTSALEVIPGNGVTYTFTVDTAGTIGTTATIEVSWTSTGGTSGRLDLGTDASYSADDKVLVEYGVLVSFGSGTLVVTETATLTCYPSRRLPHDFYRVEGDANPADVALQSGNRSSKDSLFVTDSGNLKTVERSIGQNPSVLVNYADDAAKRALTIMEANRQEVTLAENYDQHTVFLLRGGGIEPMIGRVPSFTRSTGNSVQQDPTTGRLKLTPTYTPRVFPGFELGSQSDTGIVDRQHIPLKYNHIGRSIAVCTSAVTNLMTNSVGRSASALGWAVSAGGGTVSFEEELEGVLDPDEMDFPEGASNGVTRLEFQAASDAFDTDEAVVSGSTVYQVSLWLKGQGGVVWYIKTGSGSASGITGALVPSGQTDDGGWVQVVAEVTTGAGHDRLKIEGVMTLGTEGVYYVGPCQVEQNDEHQATVWIPTTSASATRGAESLTLNDPIPPSGTISMLVYGNGINNISTSFYFLVGTTSGTRFGIRYDQANDQIDFLTTSTGALNCNIPSNGPAKERTWFHVAATWGYSSATLLAREVFFNGVSIGSDTSSDFDYGWGPLKIFPSVASQPPGLDWRVQELRMDRRVLADQEILDQYERYSTDKWTHMIQNYAGRQFRIGAISERWKSPVNPGLLLADVTLVESSVHEHSVIGNP